MVLVYGPGPDVVGAFWASLYAGVIPIPAPSPDAVRLKRSLPRLRAIAEDADVSVALTTTQIRDAARELALEQETGLVDWIDTDLAQDEIADIEAPARTAPELAYLQYTSGSTSRPRGVMLTHRNVLANCEGMSAVLRPDPDSRTLSWLPHFHDYGLMHGIIWPFFSGVPAYLMSPLTFLRRPLRWLEAVSRFAITFTGAPNFAYAACVRALAGAPDWDADLSALRVASCGAEPINPATVELFAAAFGPYGFSRAAFTPAYGLAEATLTVTATPRGTGPSLVRVDVETLSTGRVAPAAPGSDERTVVGCGFPLPDTEVAVVDPKSLRRLDSDRVGEIWVAGPSVAHGYWRNEAATREAFDQTLPGAPGGRYLRTGDLGFVRGGELFITGRLKDLLIIHGRNHYPQDIEWTAERAHPVLRAGHGAVFSIDQGEGEQLVVVQEVKRRTLERDLDPAIRAIRESVAREHDLPMHAVVLVPAGALPRTSSGKIRRQSCKRAFEDGRLDALRQDVLPGGAGLDPTPMTAKDPRALATRAERQSMLERLVAVQVGRLTGRDADSVRLDASPVESGLDSLATFRLLPTLDAAVGCEVSPSTVLGAGSLREVATALHELLEAPPDDDECATIAPAGVDDDDPSSAPDAAPVSVAQEGVWFVEKLVGPSPLYHLVQAVRLQGPLDPSALERSLQALSDRHASLRTGIEERDGVPVQVIHPAVAVSLPVVAVDDLTPDDRVETVARRLREGAQRPFDLAHPPLMRAELLRLGEAEHVLLLVVHHLVVDGWSLSVMARELRALYAALSQGQPPQLPPLSVHYVHYARRQRQRLRSPALQRHFAYWRKQLQGLPALDLATDRPRPARRTFAGGVERFEISAELLAELRALAHRENVTLFMVLLAAFQTLLMRYSGQEDLAVGSPVTGRPGAEFEGLFGFFTNTLVLRTDLSGNPSFRQLLARVRRVALEAYTHQEAPSDRLVAELRLPRDLSRNPLYPVAFAFQNMPETTVTLSGLQSSRVPLHTSTAKCDVWLSLAEVDGMLQGELEYSTDLFDADTMARLARHYRQLLAGAVADPCRSLSELPLLEASERHRILVEWNDTARAYPETSAHVLFEDQARRTPDAPAVILDDRRLSYGELNRRANQLARHLGALGVGADVLVGVCMDRSIDLLVALLGILKAGGTFVPLDPEYPGERLAFMLEDTRAPVILTEQRFRDHLPASCREAERHVLCLDADWPVIAAHPDADPARPSRPEDIAYVIYTSGSTGTPKGILVPHAGLTNHIHWLTETLRLTAADRVLHKTSISFDASVWELLAPLHVGAPVVLARPGEQGDSVYLIRAIREQEISILQMVPSALRALLDEPGLSECHSLRYVVCGGEVLDRELARDFQRQLPTVTLGNFYGPSEASDDATVFEVAAVPEGAGTVPVGRPIANVRCHVLDRHRQPVPIGVVGELYIGGAGLARGYLNRPDLTRERFVADPFRPAARLYRTGDLARYLPSGDLEYVGRLDHQKKIRGFRIEPGEIEAMLNACSGVRQSVVLAYGQGRFAHLVAYVVGERVDPGELRSRLKDRLPLYMIPSAIVPLASLPLLPNGKVDREALPAPDLEAARIDRIVPRGPIEQVLWEIWRAVLRRSSIGVHDDFFEVGGHSLLAAQIVSRARQMLQVELPLRAIFETPTIAGMARRIEELRARPSAWVPEPPIPALSREHPLPVSFSQRRMWFVQQLDPQATAYNMSFALRLTGPLDVAALAAALEALVHRHEAFRTTFSVVDGEPVQRIGASGPVSIARVDLRHLPEPERRPEAARQFNAESVQPFDLERGPLFRFVLVQLGDIEHALLWLVHHAVFDQWSAGVASREFVLLYRAFSRGESATLPPLPIQYADFAAWERQHVGGDALREHLAYWRTRLADLPVLALPTDWPRPARQTFRGSYVAARIPPATLTALKRMSARHGTTVFMSLLACFKLLLARYSGQDDLAVGCPIANRTRVVTEDLIGTLVNILVMRTSAEGDPRFSAFLARVRATALEAYAHQDLPFERLVEELGGARDASHSPVVQVLFNAPNAPMTRFAFEDLDVDVFDFDPGSVQFDLSMTVETEVLGRVFLAYSTDLFAAATAQRLLDHYLRLLDEVVTDPEQPLSAYELVSAAEKALLVDGWNRTAQPYPAEQRVDDLVASQALRTPHAVAVSQGDRCLTYAALDARANQLARFLRGRGTGPETLTGICLDRSPELLVALLAVMKAGGAYVPLDPALPRARLESMARDAGLAVVLTRSPWRAALSDLAGQTVCVDDAAAEIAACSPEPAERIGSSADLAYVIYTSGSTGRPKGVEITHRALTNFLWAMRTSPGCAARDTLLAVTTLSFDIAGLELYLPLIVGGRVELASQEEASDGRLLIERLRQVRPTIMQATPSTWRMLIDAGWAGSDTLTLLCGGEALPPELARELRRRAAAVWNMYGPTETTIWSTLERVESDATRISIGRPIANTSVYILDRAQQPVPVGVPGELCLGGHGLARGYRNEPDLTAERFIPNPFSTAPGDRLYRTGDLARYWPDGRIEHLGRLDFQVKIRGFRVEVGEVETVLRRHPSIAEVVVAAKDDRAGTKQLVAYVVGRPDQPVVPLEVRAFAQAHLPAYMVPSHLVALEAFPLTANNKIDVKALPEPTGERAAGSEPPRPPRGPLEVQLTALWSHVLGRDATGVHDDFFDLGGHSLKAVELLTHLEHLYGRKLPLAVLFEAPTVARMASLLAESVWEPPWRFLVAIQPTGSAAPLFLVPGVGGTVLTFGKLARLLGPDQPVYGLQARGLDGKDKPFTSVVEAATHYLEEVRSLRPAGPYVIGGTCTGGVIAYEMAQQLRAQGELVTLMLIETWHPSSYRVGPLPPGGLIPVRVLWSKLVGYGATLANLPLDQWPRFLRAKALRMQVLLDEGLDAALADSSYHVDQVIEATLYAVAHYDAEPYPGGLLNVVAAERPLPPTVVDTRHRWEALSRGASRAIGLPAEDSGRLFASPHVEALAICIARYAAESPVSA